MADPPSIPEILKNYAARSRNVCPICWMPLGIGEADARWKAAQIAFKGKPGFSIRDPDRSSQEVCRPVYVFGINDLLESGKKLSANVQKCHYVHYSNFGNNRPVQNLWTACARGQSITMRFSAGTLRVVGDDALYNRLEGNGLLDEAGKTHLNGFITAVTGGVADNYRRADAFVDDALTAMFAGCIDCNQCMTVGVGLGGFIEKACALIFGDSVGAFNKKDTGPRVKVEELMHYMMLSCLLQTSQDGPPAADYTIQVSNIPRKNSWKLRCLMLWCAIQILLSKWAIGGLNPNMQHHTVYIYVGVMDFFMSMWFYALHCLESAAGVEPLEFEVFHYYYASCLPMHLKLSDDNLRALRWNNLSLYVMRNDAALRNDVFAEWKIPDTLPAMQQQLHQICVDVRRAWDDHMRALSHSINTNTNVPAFFTQVTTALRTNAIATGLARTRLSIQPFCDVLTPQVYWFHFKHITLNLLIELCRRYDQKLGAGTGPQLTRKRLWQAWFSIFYAEVTKAMAQ